jgi:acyl-CoA thioester hydrolase
LTDRLCGRLDGTRHLFPVRVYYEDTDAGGVVYHARYLHFLERARTELMRCLRSPHAQMGEDFGVMFALRRCEIEFLKPARLEQTLEVRTWTVDIGGARIDQEQQLWRGDDLLIQANIRLACVTLAGRPVRIPAPVEQALRTTMAGTHPSGGGP